MKQLSKLKLSTLAIVCAVASASPASAVPFTAAAVMPSTGKAMPVKMECARKEDCAAKPKRHAAKRDYAPAGNGGRQSIFVDNNVYANPQSGQYGHYGFYGQSGSFGATGFRTQYGFGGYDHSFELKMN
jgi:hypothetical protein